MKHGQSPRVALPVANALILTLYIMNYDISSGRLFLMLMYAALSLSILAILSTKLSGTIFRYLRDIQLTFSSVILLFLVFELLAWLSPNLIPLHIRNYLATSDIRQARQEMVDYLDEAPFIKFKPNTTIISQGGYRGTAQQFVYEWHTDSLGFKNVDVVSGKGQVDIVAAGDSFTEGMGVATEKTWASLLTANGYSTYNLGVQGYAPIQLEGSLRKYGLQLRPQYVVVGYSATTFGREASFVDEDEAIRTKRFTGGIQSIVDAESGSGEIRSQAKYVVSASYLLARSVALRWMYNTNLSRDMTMGGGVYEAYEDDIVAVGSRTSMMEEIEGGSTQWERTLSAFDNIITMASDINARVILLYLPHRGETYYQAATGMDLPDRYFEGVESSLLRRYSETKGIAFLDASEGLRQYVETSVDLTSISELPYLEIDGHMSDKGHELVADLILGYLEDVTAK